MKVLLRHRIEYLTVLAIRAIVRVLPRAFSLRVGSGIGTFFYALHGSRRKLAISNLRAAFPANTNSKCLTILRGTFRQLGRHVVEFLNFDAMSADEMLALVEIEGGEHVERAMNKGRGVMYFAGHFGFWELQIVTHALRYDRIVMVARTLDNPLLEKLVTRMRTRVGTTVLSRQGAIRGLLRTLKDGGSVGMMIDQHIQDHSAVQVEYFGRPALTTSAIASLALHTGAPVVPVFAFPLSDGRYRMVYERPVEPPDETDTDAILTYTQRCTDRLEARVRCDPHLWLWMHRRWRVPAPLEELQARESP